MKQEQGFTLIEMLVAITLGLALVTGGVTFYRSIFTMGERLEQGAEAVDLRVHFLRRQAQAILARPQFDQALVAGDSTQVQFVSQVSARFGMARPVVARYWVDDAGLQYQETDLDGDQTWRGVVDANPGWRFDFWDQKGWRSVWADKKYMPPVVRLRRTETDIVLNTDLY